MNNPDFVHYNIELNERRGDKTFRTHNVNTLLKVFFNKEKEIALEKYDETSLLLQFYDLFIVYFLLRITCQLAC